MKAILGTMTFGDQVDHDVAAGMVKSFRAAGFTELDSAYVYVAGATEKLLGDLNQRGDLTDCEIATKVNPKEGGLTPESIDHQLSASLQRMSVDAVDLLYLHQPDLDTPILTTLQALDKHYQAGRFKRFGLSNYAAWQVAEIVGICEQRGYIKPTVYQGMYNALTRDVERELFLCLDNFEIAFYVYNPLAGGMLTGKHLNVSDTPADGRFSGNEEYQKRYWKSDYFAAVSDFKQSCQSEGIDPAAAALRWLVHHSGLKSNKADGIILGASSMLHFESNLQALQQGSLPEAVVDTLNRGWEAARPDCIKYFRP